MKILKTTFIVICGLIALFFLVAIFLPSTYRVERSIEINKTSEEVFNQVIDFNNWRNWEPWSQNETKSESKITGSGRGVGSTWSWKGDKSGNGSISFIEVQENKTLKMKLVFTKHSTMESDEIWSFATSAKGTIVTWSDEGKLIFPFGRYYGLLVDKKMGKDFEKGLANLKKVCEEKKIND